MNLYQILQIGVYFATQEFLCYLFVQYDLNSLIRFLEPSLVWGFTASVRYSSMWRSVADLGDQNQGNKFLFLGTETWNSSGSNTKNISSSAI